MKPAVHVISTFYWPCQAFVKHFLKYLLSTLLLPSFTFSTDTCKIAIKPFKKERDWAPALLSFVVVSYLLNMLKI